VDELDREALRETLAALEMPERGLRAWLRQLARFCARHGGQRTYPELLELIEACQRELGEGPR
jgi:hypothetical protein